MAEHPPERDRDHPHERDREIVTDRERTTHTTERSRGSSTSIAAVVGGLVVAVLVMFWLFGSGDNEAEITESSVIVEETETAADTDPATEEMVGTGAEAEESVFEPLEAEGAEETQAVEEPSVEETEPSVEEPETAN